MVPSQSSSKQLTPHGRLGEDGKVDKMVFERKNIPLLQSDSPEQTESKPLTMRTVKPVHNKVSSYLMQMLILLKQEKPFFTTVGRITSFSPRLNSYTCHWCDKLIGYNKKPKVFVSEIITHVTGCKSRICLNDTATKSVTDFEYDDFCSSMSIICRFSEENFTVDAKGAGIILCNDCNWQSAQFDKKVGKVVKSLLSHLQSKHYISLARPAAIHNTNTKDSGQTEDNVVFYKNKIGYGIEQHQEVGNTVDEIVLKYINEFLDMMRVHKDFFTNVGRIDGFGSNMIQYKCHLCHKTLLANDTSPRKFVEMIFEHVPPCKDQTSSTSSAETVDDMCVSENEFVSVYQSMLKSSTLLRESFIVVDKRERAGKVFCSCILCDWEYHFSWSGVANHIQTLMVHLQTEHFDFDLHTSNCNLDGITENVVDMDSDLGLTNINFEHHRDETIEREIINYLEELLNSVELKKTFFTTVGKVSGFHVNLNQYRCHICNNVIPGKKKPTVFISTVVKHVKKCSRKYKGNNREAMHTETDDSEFITTHKSMSATSTLIRQSLRSLEAVNRGNLFSCRSCLWSGTLKSPHEAIPKLLIHLQRHDMCKESIESKPIISEINSFVVLDRESASPIVSPTSVDQKTTAYLKENVHLGDGLLPDAKIGKEEKSMPKQDCIVEDLEMGEKVKVVKHTHISNYLDELLETIRIEKVFFTTLGRISGFSEDFSHYECHLCSHVISKQKWPTMLVLKIISHVKECYNTCPKKRKRKIHNLTTMDEFNIIFNSMVTTSKIIKESFEFEEVESVGSVFSCRECHWKLTIGFEKKIWKIITTLYYHVQHNHSENTQIKLLKENVADYLDQFSKTFEKNRELFFEKDVIHGFDLNLTKYHCQVCSAVISLGKAAPKKFVTSISVHVKNCKSKKNDEKTVYSQTNDLDFNKFYNTILRLSTLVKESLQFLKVKEGDCKSFVCGRCGWESKFKLNVANTMEKMLFHLKARHFLILPETVEDCKNSPSSILDCVYKNFKFDAEIDESYESCWIFTGEQNMFTCRICEVTVNFPMDLITFRNLVISHHKFHKKLDLDRNDLSISPKSVLFCKLKTYDKSENLKTKEKGDIFLHNMFQKVRLFGLALLASKSFWTVGNTPDDPYFSCNCNCKISFPTLHPIEVTKFLVHHFNEPEHSNSYETFRRRKLVSNTPKRSLYKLQATMNVVGFYGVYSTLDKMDKLIQLSESCLAKVLDNNRFNCTLCVCDLDIETGSNVFELRYVLWDHINSVAHKDHFPHLQEDLESLKTSLAAVLEADSQELLSHLQIGPGSNFVKCGICQHAVPMRFYAMKNHIEGHTGTLKVVVRKSSTNYVSKRFENFFVRLEKTLPKPMRGDLKFIKKGSVFGYVTCSLCCCAMMSHALHVESHLRRAEHIENRGGVWYE